MHVGGGPFPENAVGDGEPSGRRGGAFVTLLKSGELRGCVGHIEMDEPLVDVVRRCAVAACSSDPRFPAVAASELALAASFPRAMAGLKLALKGALDVPATWAKQSISYPIFRGTSAGKIVGASPGGGEGIF